MTDVTLDLEDYTIHKIEKLRLYYKIKSHSDLLEWLVDEKYSYLPQVCKKCGSREFQIKDEFLGA